jgi:anaerobic selenocysteine-containing dehydrogenase
MGATVTRDGRYLYYARKAGTQVAVINPYREPGMARYWVPSVPESALFGTKMTDRFFLVNVGGDVAFLNGALRCMIEHDWVDRAFIEARVVQSSGDPNFDSKAEGAVRRASPLPVPDDTRLFHQYFREMKLVFEPEG